MVAELVGYPHLTNLTEMAVSGGEITATRTTDDGQMTLSAQLPAVVSITEAFPAPRYPNFKGLMAAKKKPVDKLALADLGINPEDFSWAKSILLEVAQSPPREAGDRHHRRRHRRRAARRLPRGQPPDLRRPPWTSLQFSSWSTAAATARSRPRPRS